MQTLPVFVKITEPHKIGNLIRTLRSEVGETRVTLENIKRLSHEETVKIKEWKINVNFMQEKLASLDDFLHEPANVR